LNSNATHLPAEGCQTLSGDKVRIKPPKFFFWRTSRDRYWPEL